MATLTNKTIASTYTSLLKLEGDTGSTVAASSGNAVQVKTGDNDATPLYLNTDKVGIGTGAAPAKNILHVSDGSTSIGDNSDGILISNGTAGKLIFEDTGEGSNDKLMMLNHFDEALRIMSINDAQDDWVNPQIAVFNRAGQVGIGVVPEATNSLATSLQLGGNAYWLSTKAQGASGELDFGHNFYWAADGNQKYISADEASQYRQGSGIHRFKTVASGSADGTITWTTNMVLDINSRISLSNNDSGTSNTIFGKLAGSSLDAGSNYNVFIGENVSDASMNDAIHNVGIGYSAISSLTDGDYNVAVGSYAGLSNTTGVRNINIGYAAGYSNQSGNYNVNIGHAAGYTASGSSLTAVGYSALYANTSGTGNTALGYQAAKAITVGSSNVAIGNNALSEEVGGGGSVAIGTDCMVKQDGGDTSSSRYNVGVGANAGYYNKTGQYNVLIGNSAGLGQSGGNHSGNTAVGYTALTAVTSGDYNTVIGRAAGSNITTGAGNIAIGSAAMLTTTNTTGMVGIGNGSLYNVNSTDADGSVAVGLNSFHSATHAGQSVGVGSHTGYKVTTGDTNTLIGHYSGYNPSGTNGITTGGGNTSLGAYTLGYTASSDITGSYNTAVGYQALTNIEGAVANNTCIGNSSGSNITTGSGNTYIGQQSQASAVDVADEIILKAGSDAVTGGGTETVRIGVDSDFITNDFGENATWTHSSDKRIKKDIKPLDLGLKFINDLKPVTFKKKAPSEYPKEFEQYNPEKTTRANPDRVNYGFIAQEVKESMDKAGHSKFPLWKENKDGMQELGETELIPTLVKAIQELSAKVTELENKLK